MDYINKLSGNNANSDNMNQSTQNQQTSSTGSSGGGFMDKISGLTGSNQNNNSTQAGQTSSSGGGFMDKLNGMAGGGRESEKNEDYVDKGLSPTSQNLPDLALTIVRTGVDWAQQNLMGQGPQDNESAIEQAKDEQISDYIRGAYKSSTGSDIPIKDKDRTYGA